LWPLFIKSLKARLNVQTDREREKMTKGKMKWFNDSKGFGFITKFELARGYNVF